MTTGLTVNLAVAKTNKYASRESGDTAELIERPSGGFSVVAVDGQGSGLAAKTLSLLVSSKVVALLKDGVSDETVARAAHDNLFVYRRGQVSATLDILSVDLRGQVVRATRNSDVPMLIGTGGTWELVPCQAGPIGRYQSTRPALYEWPMTPHFDVVLWTDGVSAPARGENPAGFDPLRFARQSFTREDDADRLAGRLLEEAIRRHGDRVADDMTVVAMSLRPHAETTLVRRLSTVVPLG